MGTALIEPDVTAEARPDQRLDEWYYAINKIYLGRNFHRSTTSIFAHLVEACGGMSRFARRDDVPSPVESGRFVPKALAWWFALCAKVGVRSVEDMIWTKFPSVCPYCLRTQHAETACEKERARLFALQGSLAPEWDRLKTCADDAGARPVTIAEFVDMFLAIYGAPDMAFAEAFARLNEELGELAEAVRVVGVAPHYFLSEAPDVFAWLVQCHALVSATEGIDPGACGAALAERMVAAYPGYCKDCERDPCICMPVLPGSLGRLAVAGPHHEAHFRAGGHFLPLGEMMNAIAHGAGTIVVKGREFRVDAATLTEFQADLGRLADRVEKLGGAQAAALEVTIERLEGLAEVAERAETSTAINESRVMELQEAVLEFREAFDAQPPETQNQIAAFVNGLASNLAAALITGATS